MSIALFSMADASIAQVEPDGGGTKKAPPKRSIRAFGDRKAIPEPR